MQKSAKVIIILGFLLSWTIAQGYSLSPERCYRGFDLEYAKQQKIKMQIWGLPKTLINGAETNGKTKIAIDNFLASLGINSFANCLLPNVNNAPTTCSISGGNGETCVEEYLVCIKSQKGCAKLQRTFTSREECEEYVATTYSKETTGACYLVGDSQEIKNCQLACALCTNQCKKGEFRDQPCAADEYFCPPLAHFFSFEDPRFEGSPWTHEGSNWAKILNFNSDIQDWNGKGNDVFPYIGSEVKCTNLTKSQQVIKTYHDDRLIGVGQNIIYKTVSVGFITNSVYDCYAEYCEQTNENPSLAEFGRCAGQHFEVKIGPPQPTRISLRDIQTTSTGGFSAEVVVDYRGAANPARGKFGLRIYGIGDYKDYFYNYGVSKDYKKGTAFRISVTGMRTGIYKVVGILDHDNDQAVFSDMQYVNVK